MTLEFPHTHAAILTQADHAGAVDVGLAQSAAKTHTRGASGTGGNSGTHTHTHLSSAHLPDQTVGGYS